MKTKTECAGDRCLEIWRFLLESMKSLQIQCALHTYRSAYSYNMSIMYHSFVLLELFLRIGLDFKLFQKANSARSTDIFHLQGNDLAIHFTTFETKKLGQIFDICSQYLTFLAIFR